MVPTGAAPTWRILLVEDDEEDYLLIKNDLQNMRGPAIQLDWALSHAEAAQKIAAGQYDVALIDYHLGDQNGLELTRAVRQQGHALPIILLTGQGNYEIDLLAMKAGVTDYLSKSETTPSLLERAIRYAIEHRQHEAALLEANRQLSRAKDELEMRVQQRTIELQRKNERLEAEIMRRQAAEAELTELQRRLIDNAEAERLTLARELHDGPMQDLYAILFELDALHDGATTGDGDQRIRLIQNELQAVIQTLRATASHLRPPALSDFGLEKAIRSHVESVNRSQPGLDIQLNLMPDRQSLPDRVRLALFRIFQVAMANVLRHASASRVNVCLLVDENQAILEIKDNGRGFVAPEHMLQFARHGHLGLVGAAERAEAAGGKLEIETAPGEGTRIKVRIPLTSVDRT
ncbi:MAG: response regulator [Anaerolineaceae bacterium]|jgi:signal transduction histidine kinase